MSIGNRIKEIRKERGLTQKDLAKAVGMAQASLSELETGASAGSTMLASIAGVLGVRAIWLETGKGHKTVDELRDTVDGLYPVASGDDSHANAALIKRMNHKVTAGIYVHSFDQTDYDSEHGALLMDKNVLKKMQLDSRNLLALDVKGDSMEPTLFDGDTIIINTADKALRDGEIYVVNYNGQAVVKRLVRKLGEWWLSSDNSDKKTHPDARCREALSIIVGKYAIRQSAYSDRIGAVAPTIQAKADPVTQEIIDMLSNTDDEGRLRAKLAVKDTLSQHQARLFASELSRAAPSELLRSPEFVASLEALIKVHAQKEKEQAAF